MENVKNHWDENAINEHETNWLDNPTQNETDHGLWDQFSNENQMQTTENFDLLHIFDDIFAPDDLNLDTQDQLLTDFNPTVFEDFESDTDAPFNLSEEAQPVLNAEVPQVENVVPNDIQVDWKEWQVRDKHSQRFRAPKLLEFLILCLKKPHYESYISFTDRSRGIFQIHEPDKMAELWGKVRNRHCHLKMTYDKLARAIRWNYRGGSMIKTNTRYTFQFSNKMMEAFSNDENNDLFDFLDE